MELSHSYYTDVDSLESYLDALFHYYEETAKSVSQTPPSLFESILSKFGVRVSDLSVEEMLSKDYYTILKTRGLLEACNNPEGGC